MKLVSMLDEELIFENLPGRSRPAIYTNMLEKLAAEAELELDIPALVQEMLEQEKSSGAVFPGIALPHVRNHKLNDLFIVIGMPENTDAMGNTQPADMIFMSLIGEGMSDIYLKMLSAFARYMASAENAAALRSAARAGKNALWSHLQASDIKLRNIVAAEDVMSNIEVSLSCDAPLSQAFDLFNSTRKRALPVVDKENKLLGELSAMAVIKSFIPEYVFMMDNLNFLNDFAVFNEIFNSEHSLPIAKYMNREPLSAALDTPLIQLTLMLARQGGGNVYIVDSANKLKGVFSMDNIISKVLRG